MKIRVSNVTVLCDVIKRRFTGPARPSLSSAAYVLKMPIKK